MLTSNRIAKEKKQKQKTKKKPFEINKLNKNARNNKMSIKSL